MAQRRHHYEQAFEALLRRRRVPYVAVNEAKRALMPDNARLRLVPTESGGGGGAESSGRRGDGDGSAEGKRGGGVALKSFDFVVYTRTRSLLVDVKGRKIVQTSKSPLAAGRMESWVTEDDVRSLGRWRELFGGPGVGTGLGTGVGTGLGTGSGTGGTTELPRSATAPAATSAGEGGGHGGGYGAGFVFLYWCEAQPPDALFQEVFEYRDRWYAVRVVELDDYRACMTVRSPRWRTVHLSRGDFERVSQPFGDWYHEAGGGLDRGSGGGAA